MFFGTARGTVRDVSSLNSLRELGLTWRATKSSSATCPAGRLLHRPDGVRPGCIEQPDSPSRYFIYSGPLNLTGYVGPDFLHGSTDAVDVNCVLLSALSKFVRTARRYRTIQIQVGSQILTAANPLPDDRRDALTNIRADGVH